MQEVIEHSLRPECFTTPNLRNHLCTHKFYEYDNFKYLLELTTGQMTTDGVQTLKEKAAALEEQLAGLLATNEVLEWKKDLDCLPAACRAPTRAVWMSQCIFFSSAHPSFLH